MGTVLSVVLSVVLPVVLPVVSVSLLMHDPVVRTSSFVPCTAVEEWTIVASGPPVHIFHTAGGSLDTGK